ncbi:MAG: PorV/PorQ family protein [bacterium]|nr:PorV/PorQ family protein [bacterium]
MRKVGFVFLIGLVLATPCYGKVGQSTGELLKMGIGARPLGMGASFCALSDDISCIYYNQAGLSRIKAHEFIACGTRSWIEDVYKVFLGYAGRLSENNAFGVSVIYLDKGDFDLRDKKEATYNPTSIGSDMGLIFSFSQSLGFLCLGVNAKIVSSKLYNETGKGVCGDIGILLFPESLLSIGINCQNIGSIEIREKEDLPFNIKGGFAIKLRNKIIIAVDVDRFKEESDMKYHGGLEYLISDSFIVRGGYSTNDITGLLPGASFGLGFIDKKGILFKQGEVDIDYALQSFGDLGLNHRVSLIFKF